MEAPKKVIESFARAVIGSLAGLIPALTTNNVLFTVGIVGVCGVVGEIALPRFMNSFKGSPLKNLLGLLCVTVIGTAVSYEVYMRRDGYAYKTGQQLVVSHPSYPIIRMNEYPAFDHGPDEKYTVLKVGQKVTYLAALPRKSFRFPKRDDGYHFLLAFWRKVKTQDGKVGWVYGAYLRSK